MIEIIFLPDLLSLRLQMEEIIKCEAPGDWCELIGVKSYHPLVAAINYAEIKEYCNPKGLCAEYYAVSLYRGNTDCGVRYGRNMYDYQDGTLFFAAPGQVARFTEYGKRYRPEKDCLSILFHPDYIRNTSLAEKISSFKFFNYELHVALRLSDSEIEDVKRCFENIEKELKRPADAHSKDIICSAIEMLLYYCCRFYNRQFISNRNNKDILSRFESLLYEYFNSGNKHLGLPTVKYFADKLKFSPDYLSSLLQKETGKNAQEHIQFRLIESAKDKLLRSDKTISQIAYELGFEYPQYFSRLFKKKVGVSPSKYKSMI